MSASPASVPPSGRGSRFLVVGCGGIGGIVAAHLFEQGHDVVALTKNAQIADAINTNGFIVRGDSAPGQVRGHAIAELSTRDGKFDYVLLCTQPPQVEAAARSVLSSLTPGGAFVCFQNGLCEERVAKIVGPERTLGAIVAWGASMIEPGVYDRTSAGGFAIGRLDGTADPRLDPLGRALEAVGPVTTTSNLRGARWSKLAINCAISSLGTLGGDRLGVLMRSRHVRRLALEIMTEVVEVARAHGIQLEKVSGTLDLEWIALTRDERVAAASAGLVAKHALLLAVGARYRRLRSSMLSAIERGRPPAIDFLNGEVGARGREVGVATPINDAIRDEVLAIAEGKTKSSHATLRAFFDKTRKLEGAGPVSLRPPTTVEAAPLAGALGVSIVSAPEAAAAAVAPPAPGPTVEAAPLEASLSAPPGAGTVEAAPLEASLSAPLGAGTVEAAPLEASLSAPLGAGTVEAAPLTSSFDAAAPTPDDKKDPAS